MQLTVEKKKSSNLESLLIGFQRDSEAALGAVNVMNCIEQAGEVEHGDVSSAANDSNKQTDRENNYSQLELISGSKHPRKSAGPGPGGMMIQDSSIGTRRRQRNSNNSNY